MGWQHSSRPPNNGELASIALLVVQVVLCANILAAFLLVQKVAVLPLVETYVVYGSPVAIGATLWLWSSLFARRRKNVMMASALDTIAERDRIWSEQYLADQRRNRAAYDMVADSLAMNALRNAAARRKAIEDVAREFGITFAEAERVYLQAGTERDQRALKPAPTQTVTWRGGQKISNGVDWDEAPKV